MRQQCGTRVIMIYSVSLTVVVHVDLIGAVWMVKDGMVIPELGNQCRVYMSRDGVTHHCHSECVSGVTVTT